MLPWQQRLYFWGVHGVFTEVVFTSLWDFIISGRGLKLHGTSSLWSFFIYGLGTFLLAEQVYLFAIRHRIPLPLRLLMFVLLTYFWELSWGLVLRNFGANSWDYYDFKYNFLGLITLEYAPFWALSGLVFEYIMNQMDKVETIPVWKLKRHTLTR